MKRYIISILILLAAFSIARTGQAQGFKGKRLVAKYNFEAFVDYGRWDDYVFPLSITHTGRLGYIINSRFVAGVTYTHFQPKIEQDVPLITGQQRVTSNMISTAKGVFLAYYRRKKGSIAPLGLYYYGGYNMYTHVLKAEFDASINQITRNSIAQLGVGRTSILYKNLFLDFGFRVGIPTSRGALVSNNIMTGDAYWSLDRVWDHTTIAYRIGLSVVL